MKNQCNILIKSLVFISAFFMAHQLGGMDACPEATRGGSKSLEVIQLDPEWAPEHLRAKLPKQIAIFDRDAVITDEFFAHINPEWQSLKDLTNQYEKNELLECAEKYFRGDQKRCLWAQLIAVGADVFTHTSFLCSVWDDMLRSDDIQLVQYALKKMDSATIDAYGIFKEVKSVPMAQLLINSSLKMPLKHVLYDCRFYQRPLALFNFYLEQGADPNDQTGQTGGFGKGQTVLHECAWSVPECRVYIPSLLNFGARLDLQDPRGSSIFHIAAEKSRDFCACVINHLLKQSEAEIVYLGCLKKEYPNIYKTVRPFRNAIVPCSFSLKKLKYALELKNRKGKTAYEISGWEILNPKNCTYPKLKELLSKESQEK